MSDKKYRLITRSDFDGLACAVLLKELDMIDEIKFVHPKDMQDGKVEVTENDISANLPFVPGAAYAFDHHSSEVARVGEAESETYVNDPAAPSAARVVYEYFGGPEKFESVPRLFLTAVDKADSANFEAEDVLVPQGWDLLSFIMDARTGLGRFKEFNISNYDLMMKLIDLCRTWNVESILQDPDVKERVDLYQEHHAKAQEQIQRIAKVDGEVVILDFREEDTIFAVNRFLVYALYLDCSVSIHLMWGRDKQNTVLAVGSSIFFPTSVDIGDLMLKYGGGGHTAAGTCQVENDQSETVLSEVTAALNGG